MKTKLFLFLLFFGIAVNAEHRIAYATDYSSPTTSANSSPASNKTKTIEQIRALLGDFSQPDFLDVDDAFQIEITGATADRLNASFTVADGYYLYRDKIKFRGDRNLRLTEVTLPDGEIKEDEYFGETAVLKHDFSVPISFQRPQPNSADISLHATYQGCAEDGICYAPVSKTFSLTLPQIISAAQADSGSANSPSLFNFTFSPSATTNLITILLGAFVAGLLLTFTPCVLPMLPILSSLIIAQNNPSNASKKGSALTLSFAYVLGTMLSYATIGALAGATGDQLQAYFQNVWAIGILCAILVAMALSMFGVFRIQMPSWIQSKLHHYGQRMRGSLPMVFLLGAMSAVVVGACVSPILISFLGLAISTGDAWLGAQMMTALAFGMGIPLLALGFGAGHILPKVGGWMKIINWIFGVLLLAVVAYLLSALPGPSRWLSTTSQYEQPYSAKHAAFFTPVRNLAELDQQFARAASENKLVMVDYYADWCVDCVRMDKTTFRDPSVVEILENNFVSLQVDVTNPRNADGKALKKRFGVFGPPAILFFDRNGTPLLNKHFYGYLNAADFHQLIVDL